MNPLLKLFCFCLFVIASVVSHAKGLPKLIKETKPSIVGIAMFTPLESRSASILGTGFVVGDGKHIVTNYHVVSKALDPTIVQYYVALSGTGPNPQMHKMTLLEIDPVHDLALLSIDSTLPALTLAKDIFIDEGSSLYFTGFPIGAVLGLYPATHTGILSAIAPDVNPARNANDLTRQMLSRLKSPFMIYQLDATAYPGNSGSPVFSQQTNEVIGVINKVFVSAGKEAALTNPSGISYAIPAKHVRAIAKRVNLTL